MCRIIWAILFIFIICPVFSQSITRPTGATNGTLPIQLSSASQANILADPFRGQGFKVNDKMGEVDGNPFLFSEWKKGEVILKNGEKYNIQKMNFDASRDQFVYTIGDSLFEFFNNIQEIRIYNDDHETDSAENMIFRSDINPLATNFVQILSKGKITIFCDYHKTPEGENYTNGFITTTRKYVLHSIYYYIVNNKAIPVNFNSTTLGNLTSDKKTEIISFVKKYNLKVKKEQDFLKAIKYYNSINSSSAN